MSEEQITKNIIEILKSYVKDPALLEKATAETHILKDLKVNSARLVDIIIKCEDVFGTSIDDDEADRIATIGDAVALIRQKAA
ncbi:MAG: phosphopantetheine-binding protein [Deltaproteobacteria bacterium]|nr:phosphopantetheine-binding protein [Deltaproteobacteria bacterium]